VIIAIAIATAAGKTGGGSCIASFAAMLMFGWACAVTGQQLLPPPPPAPAAAAAAATEAFGEDDGDGNTVLPPT